MEDKEQPAANSTYKKLAVQCPPERSFSRAGLNDPDRLSGRQLLVAANRQTV